MGRYLRISPEMHTVDTTECTCMRVCEEGEVERTGELTNGERGGGGGNLTRQSSYVIISPKFV